MQDSSFRLIVRRGPQPNQIYELSKGIVTLGRDITNDIVINDPEVSRHHCRLTKGGGGYTIEDLGSTNGTFVNGQRLSGAHQLSHGDMLGMGETVTLAYEAVGANAAGDPRQAATMVGGSAPGGPEPEAAPAPGYGQQPPPGPEPGGYGAPEQPPGGYGTPPPQQQQPMPYESYDYEYEEGPYGEGTTGRWVVLGCGCFLVMCIVTSVIGGIIIDSKCWWDDVPVISNVLDVFDLTVDETACE
jgi:hypothetical protein